MVNKDVYLVTEFSSLGAEFKTISATFKRLSHPSKLDSFNPFREQPHMTSLHFSGFLTPTSPMSQTVPFADPPPNLTIGTFSYSEISSVNFLTLTGKNIKKIHRKVQK